MSEMTHDTWWRLLIGAAPVAGGAALAAVAAEGRLELARSPAAVAVLALVAAFGAAVAWWTARRTRFLPALFPAPAGTAARGDDGGVVLRGRAGALPDAVPLISPGGELCLWFETAGGARSLRPFLLVDGNGPCIVLPAGAQVHGTGPVPPAAGRADPAAAGHAAARGDPRDEERLLRSGDRIQVTGRYVSASPEARALHAAAVALAARSEAGPAPWRADAAFQRDLRAAALAGTAFVAAPSPAGQAPALPVIVASGAAPRAIGIGADEPDGGVFGMLAVLDSVVLVVASSMACWGALGSG